MSPPRDSIFSRRDGLCTWICRGRPRDSSSEKGGCSGSGSSIPMSKLSFALRVRRSRPRWHLMHAYAASGASPTSGCTHWRRTMLALIDRSLTRWWLRSLLPAPTPTSSRCCSGAIDAVGVAVMTRECAGAWGSDDHATRRLDCASPHRGGRGDRYLGNRRGVGQWWLHAAITDCTLEDCAAPALVSRIHRPRPSRGCADAMATPCGASIACSASRRRHPRREDERSWPIC